MPVPYDEVAPALPLVLVRLGEEGEVDEEGPPLDPAGPLDDPQHLVGIGSRVVALERALGEVPPSSPERMEKRNSFVYLTRIFLFLFLFFRTQNSVPIYILSRNLRAKM